MALFIGGVVGAVVVPGSDADSSASTAALADAPAALAGLPSSTFHMEMKVSGAGIDGFNLTMDGVQQPVSGLASIVQELPSPTGGRLKMHLVQDHATSYLAVPDERRRAAGGKSWVSFDATGFQPAGFSSNPSAMLDVLKGMGSDVTTVGHERVDGVNTTHYRTTIDAKEVADRVPGLASMGDLSGLPAIPIEVWIDGKGLPRRMRERFEFAGATMTMALTFSDFGTAPAVEVPAARDVLPVESSDAAFRLVFGFSPAV
jgi:hypothetical protein